MSVSKFSLVLSLAVLYAIYQSYNLRVDPAEFAVNQRRKINANSTKLFDFLVLTHVLEKVIKINRIRLITSSCNSARCVSCSACVLVLSDATRVRLEIDGERMSVALIKPNVFGEWLPATPRLKSADARILGVGKYFQAFYKLPLIGEWSIYLITTDYKRGKLLALESSDGILNPRFELRTNNYHGQTILDVTMCYERSSALFHYTIGSYLRFITKSRFEEAIVFVEKMYEATDEYREFT